MNYYQNKDYVSNSMLGWIERSPTYYLHKLQRNSEEFETKALENGKLLHSYIEAPSKFLVADVEKPGEKTALFIEEFSRTRDIEKSKKFAGLAENSKIETLTKSLSEPKNKNYLDFLDLADGKICLTKDQGFKIQGAINALHSHSIADRLLFPDEFAGLDVYNELEIYFEKLGVPCKSKLDKVVIDHKKKQITIIDLKTTSENPHGTLIALGNVPNYELPPDSQYRATGWFKSMFYYRYFRQGAFYLEAASTKFKDLLDKGYSISFIFVVVELGNTFDVAVYKMGRSLQFFGLKDMESLLNKFKEYSEIGFKSYEIIITI